MPPDLKPNFSAKLDLLRAVAVVCVFVTHLLATLGYKQFGSLGRFGVVLFFVHTSFVLMGSLERLQQTSETTPRLIAAFWLRRMFRIYPLACLFVALTALLHIPEAPGQIYTWIGLKGFLANFFLIQNITGARNVLGPLWSLPLEVQMYILLPFAFLLVIGLARGRSLYLWLLSLVFAVILPVLSPRLSVFACGPCFISGVVAYDFIRNKSKAPRLPAWVWPATILAAILLYGPFDDITFGQKLPRAWLLSLGVAIMYSQTAEFRLRHLQPLLHWIAEHSYGIYLSHVVLMWLAFDVLHAPAAVRILFLAITSVAIPVILYRTIEHPLILVGSRISKRLLHPPAHEITTPTPWLSAKERASLPAEQRASLPAEQRALARGKGWPYKYGL
jgi:peptidoglycan/LPS O-acetylase OafA/YrhL